MTSEDERSGDLLDVTLRDEIELVSDLVVAASSSPRHFTPDEVDELLGVIPASTASPVACSIAAESAADETAHSVPSAPSAG